MGAAVYIHTFTHYSNAYSNRLLIKGSTLMMKALNFLLIRSGRRKRKRSNRLRHME